MEIIKDSGWLDAEGNTCKRRLLVQCSDVTEAIHEITFSSLPEIQDVEAVATITEGGATLELKGSVLPDPAPVPAPEPTRWAKAKEKLAFWRK